MSKFENYYSFIRENAEDFVDEYYEDFLSNVCNGDTDSYGYIDNDGKLHDWIDAEISMRDAVEILEQSDNVETDRGLWEGLEPISAIGAMGFWTYKNDMIHEVVSQLKDKLEAERDKRQRVIDECEADQENSEAIEVVQDELDNIEQAISNL